MEKKILTSARFADMPDVLTVTQAAALLAVSKNTLYKLVRQNKIRKRRMGRIIRISKSELLSYISGE